MSKKKKDVLVEELRRLGFRPFPKKQDASKAGEKEDAEENEEGEGGKELKHAIEAATEEAEEEAEGSEIDVNAKS